VALGVGLGGVVRFEEASDGEGSSKEEYNPFAFSVDGGAYAGCGGCK